MTVADSLLSLMGGVPLTVLGPDASGLLLAAAVAAPLLVALACSVPMLRRAGPWLVVAAPLPALCAAVLLRKGSALLVFPAPFRLTLLLDEPGALLLGGAALLWLVAGRFALAFLRDDPQRGSFLLWWLFTMAGSFAVFLVADVASFYLAYALVSFAAFGLVAHEDTPEARRAGTLYLSLTVLGEACLIAAFVMLAAGTPGANPLIRDVVAAFPTSPWQGPILVLLLLGFTMKMGVVPLHVWMPLAHSVAPAPGSAALSGIVVKAGLIGLIRFLPDGVALPGTGAVLTAAGLLTAFYGVAVGLTMRHPKRALAYSTVSQMGVVAALLGAGLAAGDRAAGLLAAYYAVNHMLLKGAMFLTVGMVAAGGPRMRTGGTILLGLLGLALAGLPLTGGAFAKSAIKSVPMGDLAAVLLTLSAAGTTALTLRAAVLLGRSEAKGTTAGGLSGPCLLLGAAAVVVPILLYPAVTGSPLAAALSVQDVLKALWPIALGVVVIAIVQRQEARLPEVPAGDIYLYVQRLAPAAAAAQAAISGVDGRLKEWPVAGTVLVALAAVLVVAAMR